MSDVRRYEAPGGEVGVRLEWPGSKNFKALSDRGDVVEEVEVVPIWLENGEVRFYRASVLKRIKE